MTTATRRRRAQAAGPQRFQAPVRSARPPVWRSLLSGLVLAAVIIGLPAALLATVGPPPLPTGVDMSVLFTQAVSFDVVVGVLIWVLYLAWLQFTVCALVEAASAIKGHGVPGHVPLSGGMQSLVRRLIASVLLLGAVSGPVAAAAAPVVEEPTPAVAVSQDVSSQQPAADDDSQADGAATASQGADSDHQYMRYMVNGVELDQEIGAQLVGQRVYIVQPPEGRYHDNLWDIAERNLGEGRAYSQIYDLNAGRAQPDGGSLELARLIQPGWLLVMPESATSVARVEAIPTTPAPAPAAPTPQQQEEGNHIPAGLGQDLRDIAPVQMPAIGSLLAASLVSGLVARRRWLAGAFNEDSAELERLLRVGADESAVDEQGAAGVETGVADVGVGDLVGGASTPSCALWTICPEAPARTPSPSTTMPATCAWRVPCRTHPPRGGRSRRG